MISRLSITAVTLILCMLFEPLRAGAEVTARDKVDSFHATLINNMQSGGDFPERYARLAKAIDSQFHIETISRIAIGRKWSGLSESEQESLSQLLRELIITTYVQRFREFNGQTWKSQQVKPLTRDRVLVRTQLTTASGERVSLDYQLRHIDGEWGIFDIVANGVSDLSLRRVTYSDILNREGLPGLQGAIEDSINELLDD